MNKSKTSYPKEVYEANSEIFKSLSNPKRLEILHILSQNKVTVTAISDILHANKANVSQHLAILRSLHLIKPIREGHNVFYEVTDPRIASIFELFK